MSDDVRARLRSATCIPAHPLALTAGRKLDERRQRALSRYYLDASADGLAVGVHTTQFAIRDPRHGLLRPVLELAAETMRSWKGPAASSLLIAGAIGLTRQAVAEASLARDLGYDAVLLSLAALRDASDDELLAHAREVTGTLPVIGFYLQPAVDGRVLSYDFWRRFVELPDVVGIKIAPFDRYRTLDVVRAASLGGGATDTALLTGNDDSILVDLLTTFEFEGRKRRFDGGLLGQFAVWTQTAARLASGAKTVRDGPLDLSWLTRAAAWTDANGALFDVTNNFAGCIAGVHEALRRQGLLEGIWCLDEREGLSPGQLDEIDRVHRAYPELRDDAFVAENIHRWLS